jgi:acyl carrier protein
MRPVGDLDITAPIASLGIDSLVAIELNNWGRQRLSIRISVLEIMWSDTIRNLARLAAEELTIKLGAGAREGQKFSLVSNISSNST